MSDPQCLETLLSDFRQRLAKAVKKRGAYGVMVHATLVPKTLPIISKKGHVQIIRTGLALPLEQFLPNATEKERINRNEIAVSQ